jgi:8-oxo-dGTP pyrophosphatase MutT (NUDIX family)
MIPDWMKQLVDAAPSATLDSLGFRRQSDVEPRHAAVLIVVGPHQGHGEVIVIQRAHGDDPHSGQVAFPGGQVEPTDESLTATALREAHEEIGLDPNSVSVIAELPRVWLPPSGFFVTSVLAWWHDPHDLIVKDAVEVASVHRIPIEHVVHPENRFQVRAANGFVGPAFSFESMTVWGFTGALLSEVVDLAGWAVPWDTKRIQDLNSL